MALLRSEFRLPDAQSAAYARCSAFGFDLLISHHRLGAWSRAVYTHVYTHSRYTIYVCAVANISGGKGPIYTCIYTGNATYLYAFAAVGLSAGCAPMICRVAIEVSTFHRQIITVSDMPAGHSHGRVIKPFLYYTGRIRGPVISAFLVVRARYELYAVAPE